MSLRKSTDSVFASVLSLYFLFLCCIKISHTILLRSAGTSPKIVLRAGTCFYISLACSMKIAEFRIDSAGATVFSAAYIVSVVHEVLLSFFLLLLGI